MIKFRPVTRNDFNGNNSKSIRAQALTTASQFGSSKDLISDKEKYVIENKNRNSNKEEDFNLSLYVDLPQATGVEGIAFFNPWAVGTKCSLLNNLLCGNDDLCKQDNITKLVSGECILKVSKHKEEVVNSDTLKEGFSIDGKVGNDTVYYYGHHAIKYLFDEYCDLNVYTSRMLYFIFSDMIKGLAIKKKSAEDYLSITRGNGEYYITHNLYLNFNSMDNPEWNRVDIEERINSAIASYIRSGEYTKFVNCYCFTENSDLFKGLLIDFIPIIPIGFRPVISDRVDPMSIRYNRLMQQCGHFLNIMASAKTTLTWAMFMRSYKDIYNCIIAIMMHETDPRELRKDNSSYKPLKDLITGKHGLIRNDGLGIRTDYSGRYVITVDKSIPIDSVGIPMNALPKLLEYDWIKMKREQMGSDFSVTELEKIKYENRINDCMELAKGRCIVIGRQPTLFNLGMQAYKIRPVPGNAIKLNPLCVMPFNADFDGDQMHIEYPVPVDGKANVNDEVMEEMASTHNVLYPRNGSITVETRHEIQYGFYMASTVKQSPSGNPSQTLTESYIKALWFEQDNEENMEKSNSTMWVLFNLAQKQLVNIYDTVGFDEPQYHVKKGMTVGIACILYCVGSNLSKYQIGTVPLTEGSDHGAFTVEYSKAIFLELAKQDVGGGDRFVKGINRIISFGFAVAEIYPPSLSAVNFDDAIKTKVDNFQARVHSQEEFLDKGFITEEAFQSYFDDEFTKLDKEVKGMLMDRPDIYSGFINMIKSGGKGSSSDICQAFGIRGRMQKNDTATFNSIIATPLAKQLNPFEHFITTYGSRKGLADKILATAKPGYLTRIQSHLGSYLTITCDDCGTREGIRWTYDDFVDIFEDFDSKSISDKLAKALAGRYAIVNGSDVLITKQNIGSLVNEHIVKFAENKELVKGEGLVVRSPITCNNPCCKKCYGKSLATVDGSIKIGKHVGLLASASISEPGTQLTMKNFQKGGVASDANLTSSFDRINAMFRILTPQPNGKVMSYDPISPFEGYVQQKLNGDGTKTLVLSEDQEGRQPLKSSPRWVVDQYLNVKDYVKPGMSIQKKTGTLAVKELMKYGKRDGDSAIDRTKKYLIMSLWDIYNAEKDINLIHFECLVFGMVYYIVTDTNLKSPYKPGEYLNRTEFLESGAQHCVETIVSAWDSPSVRHDAMQHLIIEKIGANVPRLLFYNNTDSGRDIKVQTILGKVK